MMGLQPSPMGLPMAPPLSHAPLAHPPLPPVLPPALTGLPVPIPSHLATQYTSVAHQREQARFAAAHLQASPSHERAENVWNQQQQQQNDSWNEFQKSMSSVPVAGGVDSSNTNENEHVKYGTAKEENKAKESKKSKKAKPSLPVSVE